MQNLPIGIQTFSRIIKDNCLYVDKTKQLLQLILTGCRYFFARPRRFGKSLTISTLASMFGGQYELFKGLACEEWVLQQKNIKAPIIRIDFSRFRTIKSAYDFNDAIVRNIKKIALNFDIEIGNETSCEDVLETLIEQLYNKQGDVVILIDEYDCQILENINDRDALNEIKGILRSFYRVMKGCDEYIRFVFITGISKFTKVGIFSAMNNLEDITLDSNYSDLVGYTQHEIETYFSFWIDKATNKFNITSNELLNNLNLYYDGFSFDGVTRVYNPFSILNFFKKNEFDDYWYKSGSSTFIVNWLKEHSIFEPEQYRHIEVARNFTDSQEIENADPKSFLFQSGYLTIEKIKDNNFILDYPNYEVRSAISRVYLENVYNLKQENYLPLSNKIWQAINNADLLQCIQYYNTALKSIPFDDFKKRDEYWYRSLFLMLLQGSGIIAHAEIHTYQGRSDLVIQLQEFIIVLEFKFALESDMVNKKIMLAEKQMKEKSYAACYANFNIQIISGIVVACDDLRQVVLCA